jgi:hypothetical protein
MASLSKLVARLAQQQVGVTDQLMKRIQMTTRPLYVLQGFRHGGDGLDRRGVSFVALPTSVGVRMMIHGS